jgi:glycosyltransferase involved in cell wall biosynthesis
VIIVENGIPEGPDCKARLEGLDSMYTPELRILIRPHSSAAAARNTGIEVAKCPILTFLDADDLWQPHKLELQMEALEAGKGEMIFGRIEEFLCDEMPAAFRERLPPPRVFENGLSPITCLIRADTFSRVGPFDEQLNSGEFVEWFARAKAVGVRPYILPDLLAMRRLHENNHGRVSANWRSDYSSIAHRLILARRAREADAS